MSGARDLSSPEWPGGAEQGFWVLLLGKAKERMEKYQRGGREAENERAMGAREGERSACVM